MREGREREKEREGRERDERDRNEKRGWDLSPELGPLITNWAKPASHSGGPVRLLQTRRMSL